MSGFGDRKVSIGRTRGSHLASTPEAPRTPLQRSTSHLYGSPGGSFRTEEEFVVLELGARFLRGGFPGESSPRCTLNFGPDEQRRVGDYRQWDSEYSQRRRKRKRGQEWGEDYELYKMDLSDVDLGLVEDKFERAVRETYNKYFLLDPKPRKVLIALPPLMPRDLLSSVLSVLFSSFQTPSVTLMSSPVLSTVAAGLRSALVVDIGWAETTVSGICEYREIHQRRTIRAGKFLSEEMAKLLNSELSGTSGGNDEISFEEAEEVLCRVGWCKTRPKSNRSSVYFPARASPVQEEFEDAKEDPDPTITIPFPRSDPPTQLTMLFSSLAKPAETALFAPNTPLNEFDNHELPLHHLLYSTLLALPIDVRRLCMSRIVITGGVSNMPGLKTRLLAELEALVQKHGWDVVRNYGSASARHEALIRQKRERLEAQPSDAVKITDSTGLDSVPSIPAGLRTTEDDHISAKLAHAASRSAPPSTCTVGGVIRGIATLGAWAGASLIAQLRIRGIVEIEREKFLHHGLEGASREKESSVIPQRQSMGPGARSAPGERGSWTLGIWA
ncbi:actin-related protein-like protein RO7 [Delitschia confertaspora ATCC 74209]|uniref:Actin-related protein-like protein RO7 n=1 Tax=Delitschia confertaspora ATCC 74209 TaxID=1513339 RepID=A0A9P4JRP3_9PLEO|nr:actin-related protein-like protein RO7 [Delitschia confertaspora ATCC 74209]